MKDELWLQETIAAFLRCLGKIVREWREAHKFSQDEFADLAGLSRPTVSALEQGEKEPRIGTMIRLARAMDTSILVLITRILRRMNPGMLVATVSTVT